MCIWYITMFIESIQTVYNTMEYPYKVMQYTLTLDGPRNLIQRTIDIESIKKVGAIFIVMVTSRIKRPNCLSSVKQWYRSEIQFPLASS